MSELGMSDKAVLSCRNLGKSYDEGPESVVVLANLQLELQAGERVAIVGSSGSGKSTLLNMLGGLDTPSEGSVWLAGEELSALNERDRGLLRSNPLDLSNAIVDTGTETAQISGCIERAGVP